MTAIADPLSADDRDKLAAYLAEQAGLDREMRRPGLLAAPAKPPPLHRPRQDRDTTEGTSP